MKLASLLLALPLAAHAGGAQNALSFWQGFQQGQQGRAYQPPPQDRYSPRETPNASLISQTWGRSPATGDYANLCTYLVGTRHVTVSSGDQPCPMTANLR